MTSSKFEPNDDILDFVIKKANGIKGLVDRSLEIIPNQCIQPKEHILDKSQIDNQESIPTIDLSNFDDFNVEKSIQEAASKWGFFQIINHGIPIEVIEDLKDAAHEFFELPAEEKVKYYKESYSADESVLMFWSAIGDKNEKVLEWRDSIKHGCNPENDSNLWPSQTRNQVLEYQKWAKPLAKKLLEVLLKGLNVNEFDESLEPLLMGTMAININYYPPCPNPSITIGARRHCDVSCITLLFQDDTGGLYVRGTKGDNWIHVNPIKGALAVNIGDSLQIMSNDRYKSRRKHGHYLEKRNKGSCKNEEMKIRESLKSFGESPKGLILTFCSSVLSLKERIKSAVNKSSWCVAEKFCEAVLCHPMIQNTTMMKDRARRR